MTATLSDPGFLNVPWKSFRNMNSDICPVGGILRVTDCELVDGEIVAICDQPNSTPQPIYLVSTGPIAVPAYSTENPHHGTCSPLTHHGGIVRYGTGNPAYGEFWGPEAGEWHLKKDSSLGKFLILGGKKDEPKRVVAMQVSVAGPQRALARLTSAVAACNLNGTTLITLGAGNMPSGTAEPHLSAADGADIQFDTASSAETVYNPTPFAYPNQTLVWLTKAADHWLIEKAAEWTPRAFFWEGALAPDITVSANADALANLKVNGFFTTYDFGRGGLASLTGTPGEIRIDCPVNGRQFRVSWGASVDVQLSSAASSVTSVRVGPSVSGASHFPADPSFTLTGNNRKFSASGSVPVSLTQNQIISLRSIVTASGFVQQTISYAWMLIEPLF